MDRIFVYLLGSLEYDELQYLYVVVDKFSRLVEVFPKFEIDFIFISV